MNHQALPGEAQQIERDEQCQGATRARGQKAGNCEGGDAGRTVVYQADMVDPVSKKQRRRRRAERPAEVKCAYRCRRQMEGRRKRRYEKADEESLARRRVKGIEGAEGQRTNVLAHESKKIQ
ncbi:MAG: hypothetical protein ABI399_09740 [Bauldia sp.]